MRRLPELLLPALRAAREAGDAIMEVYREPFAVELKDDASPLTEADRRAHTAIVARLGAAEGGALPVLSEEGAAIGYEARRGWDYFWLVDPLDGTKEFIKRNGEFTVNIALVHSGRPVLGVVFAPVLGRLYFALDGLGAYRADAGALEGAGTLEAVLAASERLPLQGDDGPKPFTVVGSRSHGSPELEAFVESMRARHGAVEFLSAGSSLKLCLVGEGTADVYPRLGPTMEWDTAAGQAVVEKAGGAVEEWERRTPLPYNKENLLNPWFIATREGVAL